MSILAAYVVPHPPLIIPEVGRGEEKKIQLTVNAYERAMKEAAELAPDTVIIASPHTVMYADYFHIAPGETASGSFAQFGAERVAVAAHYDSVLAKEVEMEAAEAGIEAGPVGGRNAALDHAVMIPLYFLQKHTRDFRLLRVGISGLSPLTHYNFGKCIARAAETLGRRAVFLAHMSQENNRPELVEETVRTILAQQNVRQENIVLAAQDVPTCFTLT